MLSKIVAGLPPEDAIAYFAAKGYELPPTFDWRDMWQEAHTAAFTVAKSAGFDILGDVHSACLAALENGTPYNEFAKQLAPILQEKGWWGKKEMTDPVTGEAKEVQLGSPRRLNIIYDTNLRMAHAAGAWSRQQRAKEHSPYLRLVTMDDGRVREAHKPWHNVVLPVDDEWWDTHYPPNGWKDRCTTMQLSEYDIADFGYTVSEQAPPIVYEPWLNKRTGETMMVPHGIAPGFDYNPGKVAISTHTARAMMGKLDALPPRLAAEAMSASAKFVLPAVEQDTKKFIETCAKKVQQGDRKTHNERRVVGALSKSQLDYLEKQGKLPQSGAITIGDKDIVHMQRPGKVQPWEIAEINNLPHILANSKAVLWDKQTDGFFYVQQGEDGTPRVVIVKTDTATKNGRHKIVTNNPRTTSKLTWQDLHNAGRYDVVEGEL